MSTSWLGLIEINRHELDIARASAAAGCFDAELRRLASELDSLRTSDLPADRRERQIVRRERQIAAETRMRAATWYDAAAANFNLARSDDARRFAEQLLDDEQYGDRARELIARLAVQ